jgi:hypothetical protein
MLTSNMNLLSMRFRVLKAFRLSLDPFNSLMDLM